MRIELVRLEDEQAIARADFKVIVEDRSGYSPTNATLAGLSWMW
jgi:hypothetical protein